MTAGGICTASHWHALRKSAAKVAATASRERQNLAYAPHDRADQGCDLTQQAFMGRTFAGSRCTHELRPGMICFCRRGIRGRRAQCNLLPAEPNLRMWSESRGPSREKGVIMNRYLSAASALSAAVGLAPAGSHPVGGDAAGTAMQRSGEYLCRLSDRAVLPQALSASSAAEAIGVLPQSGYPSTRRRSTW